MAVGVAGRQKGRDGRQHEQVSEMRRWETPKMGVWGFLLARGTQEAITFRLLWVFDEMDSIQMQVRREVRREGPCQCLARTGIE